jgi:hypothetical protein
MAFVKKITTAEFKNAGVHLSFCTGEADFAARRLTRGLEAVLFVYTS